MVGDPDEVALAVLDQFKKLPAKRKPAVRDNGLREWVPLSGIVVRGPNFLTCVALATGMKCLPAAKLPQANGVALHDWHAEVLAIRAFNRFLLDECRRLAQDSAAESEFLRRRTEAEMAPTSDASWHGQPFAWRDHLTIHMYCSEAPCGDASMELIMSSQADATPWTVPASPPLPPSSHSSPSPSRPSGEPTLPGRSYFSRLGIVRRKPARGDAPPTHSKSCSDKLALRQCTSLLSALAALLVSPRRVYLATLVLPASQHSPAACRRCFSAGGGSNDATLGSGLASATHGDGKDGGDGDGDEGRMAPVKGRVWEGTGYAFHGVSVQVTEREFEFSRRGIQAAEAGSGEQVRLAASNLAVAWTKDGGVEEGLVGGVLQGRKAFDVRGASLTSRRRMWGAAVEVAALLGCEEISGELARATYGEVKEGALLEGRRRVKEEVRGEALKGWLRNTGDDGFSL